MIVGRGGGVVMLYVLFFFLWGLRSFLSRLVCLLDSLANEFLGGVFSRSRAARTDVMFRNLLPKEVFTKTFLFVHDEEFLPTVGSIYSFFSFCSGELRIVQIVPVMRGSTNDNKYNARLSFFNLYLYYVS